MSQGSEPTEGNDMTTNDDTDSLSWEDWLGTVDRDLMQRMGQGHERLEDWPWRAAYESGMSPWVAADRMVEDMLSGSGLGFRPAGAPASWASTLSEAGGRVIPLGEGTGEIDAFAVLGKTGEGDEESHIEPEDKPMTKTVLQDVIRSVRPALKSIETTEEERAKFLYDLVHEVYDHVKFDIHGSTVDAAERSWMADVLDAALPPNE